MKAVCLISGGMDSFVTAAIAREEGYHIYALSFDYGQKNHRELASAKRIAKSLQVVRHLIAPVDLSWTHSALTDPAVAIPHRLPGQHGIPSTYVPARNTIFISYGLAFAETVDAEAIFIGVNAIDYSGYPDCRPEYIAQFRRLIKLAVKKTVEGGRIELKTPLLHLTKAEIVKKGLVLGLDFSLSWSCYRGGKKPCGQCPSCILRERGFHDAGLKDPLV